MGDLRVEEAMLALAQSVLRLTTARLVEPDGNGTDHVVAEHDLAAPCGLLTNLRDPAAR